MKKIFCVIIFLAIYSLAITAYGSETKKSDNIDNPLFLGHFMSKGYSINAGATWIESIDELGIIAYDRIAIADKSKPNGFNNLFVDYVLEYKVQPKNASESTAIEVHVLNSTIVINMVYMPETDSYVIVFKTNEYDEKRRDIIYKDDKKGDEEKAKSESDRKAKEQTSLNGLATIKQQPETGTVEERALITALQERKMDEARKLLNDKKIDINVVDVNGHSALFWAIIDDDISMAIEIVKKGAKLNIVDSLGDTPLIDAIISFGSKPKNNELFRLMINHHVDVNQRNSFSKKTPLEFAKNIKNKNPELYNMLIKAGAK